MCSFLQKLRGSLNELRTTPFFTLLVPFAEHTDELVLHYLAASLRVLLWIVGQGQPISDMLLIDLLFTCGCSEIVLVSFFQKEAHCGVGTL